MDFGKNKNMKKLKEQKIKQITQAEFKGKIILYILMENGKLFLYEKDLKTLEENWKLVNTPI